MEKDIVSIMIFILVALLAIAIVYYSFSIFLKNPEIDNNRPAFSGSKSEKKNIDNKDEEVKRIIEKSDFDYKTFMKKR